MSATEGAVRLVETGGLVYNRSRKDVHPRMEARAGERTMRQDDRLRFLRTVPLLAGMDDDELAKLNNDLRQRSFSADETIFFQDDSGHAVYIIESGRVRIYVHGEDGQEMSVAIYHPGDLFGEMSLIDQQPRSATAMVMEDAALLALSADDFYRHLRESHQLALNVMLALSTRLRQTNESMESLATLDVTRRLVKKLLYLAQRQGVVTQRGIQLRGRLTQQALASLIGASRESVNRAMRALERAELVVMAQGRILLRKPQDLEQLVAGDN